MKKLLKKQKGFTLVELLVVIAILGILATVSVVGYTTYIKNARNSNAQTELVETRTALMAASFENPVSTEGKVTGENTDHEYVAADFVEIDSNKYLISECGHSTSEPSGTQYAKVGNTYYTVATDQNVTTKNVGDVKEGYWIVVTYGTDGKFTIEQKGTADSGDDFNANLQSILSADQKLSGTFTTEGTGDVAKITYTLTNKGFASWTLASDAIEAGK